MRQIEVFIQYLQFERRYSPHTVESYQRDLSQFGEYLNDVYQIGEAKDVSDQMIRSWLAHLMDLGLSAKTVNRKISSLKSFYKYLMRDGSVSMNPTIKIQGPKQKKRLPVFIEERKMKLLLEVDYDSESFKNVRDLLIVELFYSTGIRREELIGLKKTDVSFSNMQIKVLGKRSKETERNKGVYRG